MQKFNEIKIVLLTETLPLAASSKRVDNLTTYVKTVHSSDSTKLIGNRTRVVGMTNAQAGKNRLSRCLKKTGMRSMVKVLQHHYV